MSDRSDPAIRFERRGSAAWIALNRPEALNSISPQLVQAFNAALDAVQCDPSFRSIVVTGTGRAFCTGGDLKAVSVLAAGADLAAASSAFLASISALMSRLERVPLPVIGAINGLALAGGLELALCCDIVIAAEGASFGDVHARYGLLPGGGGSVRLPRKIGANRAKYLMFTAEQVPALRMMEWGLVAEVVALSALEARVAQLADALAAKSALGLRRMKQMVDDGLEQPIEVALRAEQIACEVHNGSFDRREGLAAFSERRAPRFEGR
jgi:enoyl-CoA hydratase/carnithine racemase